MTPDNAVPLIRVQILLDALTKISKPEGAYSRDRERYFANIIEWCQDTALEALKAFNKAEQLEENDADKESQFQKGIAEVEAQFTHELAEQNNLHDPHREER